MATRFYLPTSGTPIVSPSFSAEWNHTTDADRMMMVTTRINSAMVTKLVDASIANNDDILARQYISEPLAAQTISGTVKGQIRVRELALGDDLRSQFLLRAVSTDGSTERGVLYAGDLALLNGNPPSEWGTSLANRRMPRGGAIALTTTDIQSGDRLVAEIGARSHADNANPAIDFDIVFGDNAGADLPEDETTTTASNPWLEFSQTLTFYTLIPRTRGVMWL